MLPIKPEGGLVPACISSTEVLWMCSWLLLPVIALSSVAELWPVNLTYLTLEKDNKKETVSVNAIGLIYDVNHWKSKFIAFCFDFIVFTTKMFVVERVIWYWLFHKELKSNLVRRNPNGDAQMSEESKEQDY